MKLISWNCQGAFRKKAGVVLELLPDLVVVQECEHPDRLLFGPATQQPTDFLWFGDNVHKGVGVFSYGNHRLKLHESYNSNYKTIVPISVTGGPIDFTLFAICANNPTDKKNQYIGQVWQAVNHYEPLLSTGFHLLIGDFNSNKIWDRPKRIGNHSDVVDKLNNHKIISFYHGFFNQEQGKEAHPTFFLYRHKDKPYHLDYCFGSIGLCKKLDKFELGNYEDWIAHSDHMPLIVQFRRIGQ